MQSGLGQHFSQEKINLKMIILLLNPKSKHQNIKTSKNQKVKKSKSQKVKKSKHPKIQKSKNPTDYTQNASTY